jgi:hypothetical protein
VLERLAQVGFGELKPGLAGKLRQRLQPRNRAERRQPVSQSLIAAKVLDEFQSRLD